MSWYTRPQDSSPASCKHYLSIINTARTCFCFSLQSTDTHYPSQSSCLLIDGFGLLNVFHFFVASACGFLLCEFSFHNLNNLKCSDLPRRHLMGPEESLQFLWDNLLQC